MKLLGWTGRALHLGALITVLFTSMHIAAAKEETQKKLKPGERVWRDLKGRKLQGKLLRIEGDHIFIKRSDNSKVVKVARKALCLADRQYVNKQARRQDWDAEIYVAVTGGLDLLEFLGHPLLDPIVCLLVTVSSFLARAMFGPPMEPDDYL